MKDSSLKKKLKVCFSIVVYLILKYKKVFKVPQSTFWIKSNKFYAIITSIKWGGMWKRQDKMQTQWYLYNNFKCSQPEFIDLNPNSLMMETLF